MKALTCILTGMCIGQSVSNFIGGRYGLAGFNLFLVAVGVVILIGCYTLEKKT